MSDVEHIETVVVGGGQTGLAVGSELRERGMEFVILDAGKRVGDAWRNRWDSLLLFTPARFNGLPGMPFPGPKDAYVGKDQIADFLEHFATIKKLPVRNSVRVERLDHDGRRFVLETTSGPMTANNAVVAMADYQVPKIPRFGAALRPDINQLHSSQYKNASQLRDGPTLIVGFGNSGADIGLEIAKTGPAYIAGNHGAVVPFRIENWFGRTLGVKLVRFITVRVLNTSTPIGRRLRPKLLSKSAPIVRVKPRDLVRAGAIRVPRVTGVSEGGLPQLGDGRILEVDNVIWCTGFETGFSWIDLPVFDDHGRPDHIRGVVSE
ncbi:MAG: NAD(P)-binding domain-containing protein, partial [Acidimicrobiia bacterium]